MAAVSVATATDWSGSSSSSSSSSSLPNWVMLDPYVFKRYDLSTFQEDETTSPQSRTSEGEPFRVSFSFSPPPAVSRFNLHLLRNPEPDSEINCRIVSSHRDILLFCLDVPLPVPVDKFPADFPYESLPRLCRKDLFIYRAGSPSSLILLPPCYEIPVEVDEESGDTSSEELYDPLPGIFKFIEPDAIGVLSNDNGDFIVAYLCVNGEITVRSGVEEVEAHMCLYSSATSEWELCVLPIYCEQENITDLMRWSTKQVVSFDSYICWIDHSLGVLFCQISREDLRVSYIRLPMSSPHPCDQPCVDIYRNICLVEDKDRYIMKFLDVRPSAGYVYLPHSPGFEFKILNFIIQEDSSINWKQEDKLGISHTDLDISHLIPSGHGPLMFPILSMEDPYVAYFVVGERRCGIKKVWILPVDLISKSARNVFPYLNGSEDLLGDDANMAKFKAHCLPPFFASDITKFVAQEQVHNDVLRYIYLN